MKNSKNYFNNVGSVSGGSEIKLLKAILYCGNSLLCHLHVH